MIALCDALVQSDAFSEILEARVLSPLRAAMTAERDRKARQTAATRVNLSRWCAGKAEAMTTIAELPAGFADKVLSAQSTPFRDGRDGAPGSIQPVHSPLPPARLRR